ncbi:MAG: VOC family protein [Anaerolineaceae bacterium]|nr:VOC family protein [Anaerolineaceae bacterium]
MREFTRLFHLSLHVNDLQQSIAFYNKLGFEHMFTLKLKDGRDWLAYVRITEGQYLELFPVYEDHPMTPRGPIELKPDDNFGHFSFLVPDIYAAACDWAKKGVHVVYAPFKPERIPLEDDSVIRGFVGADRNHICWIQDPDGNWIEIMEELEDSWQKVFEEAHPF